MRQEQRQGTEREKMRQKQEQNQRQRQNQGQEQKQKQEQRQRQNQKQNQRPKEQLTKQLINNSLFLLVPTFLFFFTFLFLFLFLFLNPVTAFSESEKAAESQRPGVVCTTSILAYLTEQIGQEFISVTTIAPAGMCPAHFDLKPSQVQAVREAKVLISHDFEPWMEDLLISAGHPDIKRLILPGYWNTPPAALEKIKQITDTLSGQFPQEAPQFLANAEELIAQINQVTASLKARASELRVKEYQVITSIHQKPLVIWLGLKVVASYPSPETISTRQFLELLLIGKREGVDIIVDNLQSGTDFGARLASDLKAQQAILTNFPGLVPQTETFTAMLSYNAEQLFKIIEKINQIDQSKKQSNQLKEY